MIFSNLSLQVVQASLIPCNPQYTANASLWFMVVTQDIIQLACLVSVLITLFSWLAFLTVH